MNIIRLAAILSLVPAAWAGADVTPQAMPTQQLVPTQRPMPTQIPTVAQPTPLTLPSGNSNYIKPMDPYLASHTPVAFAPTPAPAQSPSVTGTPGPKPPRHRHHHRDSHIIPVPSVTPRVTPMATSQP